MTSTGTKPIVVYQIINLVNGKFYIGVTKLGISTRRIQHLREARRGKLDYPLYRAIRMYGDASFAFVVLCEVATVEEAFAKEIHLISIMKPHYNATNGGDGLSYWTGKRRDAATKRKISITKTGVPRSPPPAHALEIFRENMRRAAAARKKPVVCVNDGKEYASTREAAKAYGLYKTSVADVARGRRKQANGLRFEFVGGVA